MDKQQFFSQQTFSFFNSQDPNAYNNPDLSFSNDNDAINQNSNQNIGPKQEENTQEQKENQNKQSEKNPEKSSEEKQEQKVQQEEEQLKKQQEKQQQLQEEIQEERKETEEKQFEDQKQQEKKVVKKSEQPKNYGELASQVLKVKEEEIKKSLTKSPIKEQILQNEMKKPLNFFDYIRLFFKKIPSDGLLPNAQKASYTLYEDLKIMEYLGEKNKGNTISQGYKALSNGQILYRSFNSIRSRFEDCLKNLNKQDMCKIMKYIGDSNNLKGFLVFQKTINQQGQTIRTLKEISKSDPKFLVNDPSLSKILQGTKTNQQNKRNREEIVQKPKPLQPLNTKKQLIDNLKYAPKENLEKKIKTNQNIDIIISKPTQQQQLQISQQEKQLQQQQQQQQQQIQQKQMQKQQKQQIMSKISVINSKEEEDIRKFQEEKEESSELSSEEIAAIVQLNEAELRKLGSKKLAQIQKTVQKTKQQIHNKQMQNEEKARQEMELLRQQEQEEKERQQILELQQQQKQLLEQQQISKKQQQQYQQQLNNLRVNQQQVLKEPQTPSRAFLRVPPSPSEGNSQSHSPTSQQQKAKQNMFQVQQKDLRHKKAFKRKNLHQNQYQNQHQNQYYQQQYLNPEEEDEEEQQLHEEMDEEEQDELTQSDILQKPYQENNNIRQHSQPQYPPYYAPYPPYMQFPGYPPYMGYPPYIPPPLQYQNQIQQQQNFDEFDDARSQASFMDPFYQQQQQQFNNQYYQGGGNPYYPPMQPNVYGIQPFGAYPQQQQFGGQMFNQNQQRQNQYNLMTGRNSQIPTRMQSVFSSPNKQQNRNRISINSTPFKKNQYMKKSQIKSTPNTAKKQQFQKQQQQQQSIYIEDNEDSQQPLKTPLKKSAIKIKKSEAKENQQQQQQQQNQNQNQQISKTPLKKQSLTVSPLRKSPNNKNNNNNNNNNNSSNIEEIIQIKQKEREREGTDRLDSQQLEKILPYISSWFDLEPEKYVRLLDSVSANYQQLELFLQTKDEKLVWIEQEDEVLMSTQTAQDPALRLLIRRKGEEAVRERIQYLDIQLPFEF